MKTWASLQDQKFGLLFRKNGFVDHINERSNLNLLWSFEGDFQAVKKPSFSSFKEKLKKLQSLAATITHILGS